MSPEKKQRFTGAREKATEEKEKVRRERNTLSKLRSSTLCVLSKDLNHSTFPNSCHRVKHVALQQTFACDDIYSVSSKHQTWPLTSPPNIFLVWNCVIVAPLSVF